MSFIHHSGIHISNLTDETARQNLRMVFVNPMPILLPVNLAFLLELCY